MKIERYLNPIFIFLVLFLANVSFVWGNPIPIFSTPPRFLVAALHIYTILFYFTYIIEFNIIYHFLKYDNTKRSKLRNTIVSDNLLRSKLRKAVVSVNLLTYPLTQMIAITSIQKTLLLYFIIELIPIILEFLLFLKIFRQFLDRGYFRTPIPVKITGLSILGANLGTFIIGIGFNHVISFLLFPFQSIFF